MKTYKTRTSLFHIDNHGIVYKTVREGVNVTAEDMDEDQQMLLKLAGGKKVLVLVKATVFHTMTPEANEKLKSYASRSRYATALVSDKLGVRIFVDTLSSMIRNASPFKMFKSEQEAVKWLLSVKRKQVARAKKYAVRSAQGPKVQSKLTTKACEVSFDKHGILTKKIYKNAHINLGIARQSEVHAHKLAGNKKVLALIDRRYNYTMTRAAIKYLQDYSMADNRIATALISKKSHDVLPRPSKKLQKAPVRVFGDKASAIKWLLSLKKKGVR